jgi:hypothetical protein
MHAVPEAKYTQAQIKPPSRVMFERGTTDYEIRVPVPLQGLCLFIPRKICVANYSPHSHNTCVIVTTLSVLRANLLLRFKH